MNRHLLLLLLIALFGYSCSEDRMVPPDSSGLTEYQLDVIEYFKDIALGFEFGSASAITRKWKQDMKVYVGGQPSDVLLDELEAIRAEINELASDGFSMEIVSDSTEANFYLFLGSGDEYGKIFPGQDDRIASNWGLFSVNFNGADEIFRGNMYVDTERAMGDAQKHLLREELTQSLGLARDSEQYPESIFQAAWTTTTEYAMIDRDLIRLLYHPDVVTGLNEMQVDAVLRDIMLME